MAAALVAAVLGIAGPSGNITCFPLDGTLHCRIARAVYRRALEQQCSARASLDWHGFELAPSRRAVPSCSGGALASRPFECTSRITGMTCTAGSHGIFISRASWRGW